MKSIYVLGCSHTAGSELIDEHIIPNYWSFQDEDWERTFEKFKEHMSYVINYYGGDQIKYEAKCRKLNWVNSLKKKYNGNDVNIIDHSFGGIGIKYFKDLYNKTHKKNLAKDVLFRRRLKEYILESDVLIWQLTVEPRYYELYTDNQYVIVAHNLETFINNMLIYTKIPKWQRNLIIDYYKNIHNEIEYRKDLMNFVDLIIYQRSLMKKHTIFFTVSDIDLKEIEYKKIENEYTNWLYVEKNKSISNLLEYLVMNSKIKRDDTLTKFNHISKNCHELICNYMFDYINDKGLLK
jgi:hypothetical protein